MGQSNAPEIQLLPNAPELILNSDEQTLLDRSDPRHPKNWLSNSIGTIDEFNYATSRYGFMFTNIKDNLFVIHSSNVNCALYRYCKEQQCYVYRVRHAGYAFSLELIDITMAKKYKGYVFFLVPAISKEFLLERMKDFRRTNEKLDVFHKAIMPIKDQFKSITVTGNKLYDLPDVFPYHHDYIATHNNNRPLYWLEITFGPISNKESIDNIVNIITNSGICYARVNSKLYIIVNAETASELILTSYRG